MDPVKLAAEIVGSISMTASAATDFPATKTYVKDGVLVEERTTAEAWPGGTIKVGYSKQPAARAVTQVRCDCGWVGPVPNNIRCPKCNCDLAPWEPRIVKSGK